MLDIFASVMLADHAELANGKLFINGGGWTWRSAAPIPWALSLEVKAPWTEMNRQFTFVLDLVDSDGQPCTAEGPEGLQPVTVNGGFKLTAGPQQKAGSRLVGLAALVLPPLPLESGHYEWNLSINGQTREEWKASFAVIDVPGQMPGQMAA